MNMHIRLASLCCILGFAAVAVAVPPIRIMPLGDSITYGVGAAGGYRLPLYTALTNAGFNVDYVGTQTGNGAAGLGDSDHEGHSGWTIGGLYDNILLWFSQISDPDVVLLHIGTNDSGAPDFSNRPDALDALITRIATNRPYAHIIVTTLLPRSDNADRNTAITNLFNPYVQAKVTAQQALGRRVHFLDMYSKLTTDDLVDKLHPNATGYAKMAAAWFDVVTNLFTAGGDKLAPAIAGAWSKTGTGSVSVKFSKPVSFETATNAANYAIAGATVTAAGLSADQRVVTLTVSPALAINTSYTVSVSNVSDLGTPAQTVSGSVTFKPTLRGAANNVPASEREGFHLVYALELPEKGDLGYRQLESLYSTNNSAQIADSFDRVAYYLELEPQNGDLQYVWVSMDPFVKDVSRITIPTFGRNEVFQQSLANMNVYCNKAGVQTGTGLTGNIEFWPYNYDAMNTTGVPNASDSAYDFGDRCDYNWSYGSMQIHNTGAKQTVFAFNHFHDGNSYCDLGIGSYEFTGNNAVSYDWTFCNNAGSYTVKHMEIYVRPCADTVAPTVVSAEAQSAGKLVLVEFSERLLPASVTSKAFALDNGVAVYNAELLPDNKTVRLTTSKQPSGATLTLAVNGVRDFGGGNAVADGTTATLTTAGLPAAITSRVGSLADGYKVVYKYDIPIRSDFRYIHKSTIIDQSDETNAFDRVAYYMELVRQSDGATQYVWSAFDKVTPERKQLGVPTFENRAYFGTIISNLTVKSNVVTSGNFVDGGNIEFWPCNYSVENDLGIPNASATSYDFGDKCDANHSGDYGSMQIHNHSNGQTLMALNHFGNDGLITDVGIGNFNYNYGQSYDWTFTANAENYCKRTLYVLVHTVDSVAAIAGDIPSEVKTNLGDEIKGWDLLCSITNIPTASRFNDATWASTNYFIDRRASTLPGCFNRVAYYMELQTASQPSPQWVWTAMDAFTDNPSGLGVPTSSFVFKTIVNNLDIRSNVPGITAGTGLSTGIIEFWASNYGTGNTLNVGASTTLFDFDDAGYGNSTGYGSMQVHNYAAGQTLWAFNNFNNGSVPCLGFGNSPSSINAQARDWTFAANAASYTRRVLHVFIKRGAYDYPSTFYISLAKAWASTDLDKVMVRFSTKPSEQSIKPTAFSIDGLTVTGAELVDSYSTNYVCLTTSPMTAGTTYTLTVNGVTDSSGNVIPANTTATFTAPVGGKPSILSGIKELDGFRLIHRLAIPNLGYFKAGADYQVDESFFPHPSFDRIGYALETVTTDAVPVAKWVFVSMNAYTRNLGAIGLPTADRASVWQQKVTNMNVYASSNASVTTGVGIATGNIEFWPGDYTQALGLGLSGATSAEYDFDDYRNTNPPTSAGHGSMQIHNWGMKHTILSVSHCGNDNFIPCIGIGNNPVWSNHDPDWTFTYNAATYATKNLYVFVRDGVPPQSGSVEFYQQPQSIHCHEKEEASFYVLANGATAWQWYRNGKAIPGATGPKLVVSPAMPSDAGNYTVMVYTASGNALSDPATLSVAPSGTTMVIW
jgi:lysophospholipase L1-like esterase